MQDDSDDEPFSKQTTQVNCGADWRLVSADDGNDDEEPSFPIAESVDDPFVIECAKQVVKEYNSTSDDKNFYFIVEILGVKTNYCPQFVYFKLLLGKSSTAKKVFVNGYTIFRSLTPEEYNDLYYTYRTSKTALSYIADYDNLDVVIARIDGNSSSRWLISPPARYSLINCLNGTQEMSIQFDWQFKRAPDENLQYGVVEDFRVIELGVRSPIREQLIDTILGVNKTQILIPNLFPSMVEVPGEGKADHVSALLHKHLRGENLPIEHTFTDVLLELEEDSGVEWWKLRMLDAVFDPLRIADPIVRDQIIFHGFVDKVFPKSFSFITGGGILGLYVSIVLVLGHYVRGMVTDSMKKMMFEELPNVDRLLQLCQDIFLVRDSGEFELEEDLFAKLVFLFRSPATLIKWTKER